MEDARVAVRASPIAGLGVFATAHIAKAARIRRYEIVREITDAQPLDPARGEELAHCTYPDGRVLLVGPPDRHFNHSCDPNAAKRFEGGEILLFARREIAPDEEITHDYSVNTHGGSSWACRCGAARCRGEVAGSFFRLPLEIQLEYLPDLAPWFVERHRSRVVDLERAAREGAPR